MVGACNIWYYVTIYSRNFMQSDWAWHRPVLVSAADLPIQWQETKGHLLMRRSLKQILMGSVAFEAALPALPIDINIVVNPFLTSGVKRFPSPENHEKRLTVKWSLCLRCAHNPFTKFSRDLPDWEIFLRLYLASVMAVHKRLCTATT